MKMLVGLFIFLIGVLVWVKAAMWLYSYSIELFWISILFSVSGGLFKAGTWIIANS